MNPSCQGVMNSSNFVSNPGSGRRHIKDTLYHYKEALLTLSVLLLSALLPDYCDLVQAPMKDDCKCGDYNKLGNRKHGAYV